MFYNSNERKRSVLCYVNGLFQEDLLFSFLLGSTRFAGTFLAPHGQEKRIMLKREKTLKQTFFWPPYENWKCVGLSKILFQIPRLSVHPSVILSFRLTQKIALLQSFGHPCVVRSLRPSGGARQYPRSGYFLVIYIIKIGVWASVCHTFWMCECYLLSQFCSELNCKGIYR